MKTIKISDSTHRLLKIRAAELGWNIQELAEEALLRGLATVNLPSSDSRKQDQDADRKKDHGEGR